jgi:hypothetical protein
MTTSTTTSLSSTFVRRGALTNNQCERGEIENLNETARLNGVGLIPAIA